MRVRGARADDAEVLLRLRCALWPDLALDRHREVIRLRGGSSARHETFVVEDDAGAVCGFLELTRDSGGAWEAPRVVVDGVFVIPPARRQGMARQLVQAAERWAHGRGATTLSCDLDTDSEDQVRAMGWLGFGSAERRVRLHRGVSAPLEMARGQPPGQVPDQVQGQVQGQVQDQAPAPGVAIPSEPVLVMEPVRGRGFFYMNVVLFVVALVSFVNTDIYSTDMLRGVALPLLDVVFVIYFLFLFMMQRYRKRADSSARAERLFRDGS